MSEAKPKTSASAMIAEKRARKAAQKAERAAKPKPVKQQKDREVKTNIIIGMSQLKAREAVANDAMNEKQLFTPEQFEASQQEIRSAYDDLLHRKGDIVKAAIHLEDWITTMQVAFGFLHNSYQFRGHHFSLMEQCPQALHDVRTVFFTPHDDVEERRKQLSLVDDVLVFAETYIKDTLSYPFIKLCRNYAESVIALGYFNFIMEKNGDNEIQAFFHYVKKHDFEWCKQHLGFAGQENADELTEAALMNFAAPNLSFMLYRNKADRDLPMVYDMDDIRQPEFARLTPFYFARVAAFLLNERMLSFENGFALTISEKDRIFRRTVGNIERLKNIFKGDDEFQAEFAANAQ